MKKAAAVIGAALVLFTGAAGTDHSFDLFNDTEIIRAPIGYNYLSSISSNLSISGKCATCTSNVFGMSGTSKIKVTQALQKKNGGSWETVSTWKTTYNSWYCNYTNSKSSLSSGTYRLKTVVTVYNGSNSEKVTSYSNNVKC